MVTDKLLISRMKKSHAGFFMTGMSVMILNRYDETLFKMNVAEVDPVRYVWWINLKSIRTVDEVSAAAY